MGVAVHWRIGSRDLLWPCQQSGLDIGRYALGAALAVAGTLLAACGGSASRSDAASEPTTTSPAPAPTTAPPRTTAPAPTTATPTTVASTTTTLAPTSTTLDARAKVIADFDATHAAFNACTADPDHCDVSTIAAPGSKAFAGLSAIMAKLARNGLRGRPSAQDYRVVEGLEISATGTTATLRTCIFDAGMIYDPRGTTDPSDDVIVNDAIASTKTTWTMALTPNGWRQASSQVTTEKIGENQCPAPGS